MNEAPGPLKKMLIWAGAMLLVAAIAYGWWWLRKRRGRAYARIIEVDKSSGVVSLEVNGALKRFIVEPGQPKTFSPAGYVQVIPTDTDPQTNRVTRAKLYVFDAKETPYPAETLEIVLV